ncbi:MAG TPA: hypothetical protein VHB50_06005 [Bryobacteraceae bacterium]|nr:hypothetical protein [Bryobacteraceae bacterium]
MGSFTTHSSVRRALLKLAPAAVAAPFVRAQSGNPHYEDPFPVPGVHETPQRLPNGKLQRDEILKADYDQNLKDARDLMDLSKSFELELEKSDPYVLSLGLLKKLDGIEKVTRRIRSRMRR